MPDEKDYTPTEPGSTIGDQGDQVERLQAYLSKFGYLRSPSTQGDAFARIRAMSPAPRAKPATFDDATYAALRRYQQFFGLPVTGALDEATVAQMSRPRCGFPDLPRGGGSTGVSSFVAQGNSWTNTNLTYGFQNFTGDLITGAGPRRDRGGAESMETGCAAELLRGGQPRPRHQVRHRRSR